MNYICSLISWPQLRDQSYPKLNNISHYGKHMLGDFTKLPLQFNTTKPFAKNRLAWARNVSAEKLREMTVSEIRELVRGGVMDLCEYLSSEHYDVFTLYRVLIATIEESAGKNDNFDEWEDISDNAIISARLVYLPSYVWELLLRIPAYAENIVRIYKCVEHIFVTDMKFLPAKYKTDNDLKMISADIFYVLAHEYDDNVDIYISSAAQLILANELCSPYDIVWLNRAEIYKKIAKSVIRGQMSLKFADIIIRVE